MELPIENQIYSKGESYEVENFYYVLGYVRAIHRHLKGKKGAIDREVLNKELQRLTFRIAEYMETIDMDYDILSSMNFFNPYIMGKVSEETAFALYSLIGTAHVTQMT